MRSSGLVFSKENWNPLNTRVFSPDTKSGVPIAAGTLVLSGLFKCSEPQKEVTPESLTTPCSSVSFPMYRWMVSNNLPFRPMAQCSMGMITIYRFTSSKWSVLFDYTCRMAQCCETTSPLFRSLTNLRKVLLVSMTQSMRCCNLDVLQLHHGALGRALPNFLVDWGQPQKGFDVLLYPELCSSLISGVDTSFGLPPNQDVTASLPEMLLTRLLTNGYTSSPAWSPYAKPISTTSF